MNWSKYSHCRTGCIVAAVLASLLATYAQAWGTIEGQVLDDETQQPIPGAIVVATWYATSSGFPDSHSKCLHVESATADAAGRYRLPDWHGWWYPNNWLLFDRVLGVGAHKFRYEPSMLQVPTVERIYLKPFKGPDEAWLERPQSTFSCFPGVDESAKNLYRVWAAIVADETPLASTAKQMQQLRSDAANAKVLLVNHAKPTTFDSGGYEVNVNPNDAFKPEDLLK
jgi:hypothetical protein